jgi:hypothetical protein
MTKCVAVPATVRQKANLARATHGGAMGYILTPKRQALRGEPHHARWRG